MAKKTKKALALLLAVALCVGQMAIPVYAQTVTSDPVANPDGSVTVTTVITDETGNSVTTIVTNEKETETEHSTKTDITTETDQDGVSTGTQEDVVLEEVKTETQTPGGLQTDTTETGEWVNEGQAEDTWNQGETAPEVLGEATDLGTPEEENLDLDPLAGNGQVELEFEAPKGGAASTDEVKINITEDLIAQYQENGYDVSPVYDEADPTKIIGWSASKTEQTGTQQTPGTASAAGDTTVANQSAGVQVADPELDKALGEVTTTEGNVTTTVKLEKSEGTPSYTRTTTVTTVKDPVTGEPVALTEQEKQDLAATLPGETKTTYNYLTGIVEQTGSTDAEGNVTSYQYTYVRDAQGNILSYTQDTIITNAEGKVLAKGSDTFHCTTIVTTTYTVVDPTTKQTTTFDTITETKTENITITEYAQDLQTPIQRTDKTENFYELETESYVAVDGSSLITDESGNLFVVYEGRMFPVKDLGKEPTANHVVAGTNTSSNQGGTWRYDGDHMKGSEVVRTNGEKSTPTMFEIRSGKEVRYVYCVELDQSTGYGSYNLEADFFSDNTDASKAAWSDSIPELRSVAINGFWDTDSGIGSLDSVKSLLKRYQDQINKDGVILTDEDIEDLSASDALTATQVALWKYGANNSSSFGTKFSKDSTIVILRDLLVDLADSAAAAPSTKSADKELTGDKVTGAKLVLKDKVSENEYNTDLVFKLNVSESAINGNLIVEVVDVNNKVLGQYRLAEDGTKDNFFTTTAANLADAATGTKQVKADGNGNYTLEDLTLANGVKFTVNLRGTQHLDDGVTIYMSKDKQDFIGLVSKDKDVNLAFDMEFTATETEVEKTSGKKTQTGTVNNNYTGTRTQHQVKTSVKVETEQSATTDSKIVTQFLGDLIEKEDVYAKTGSHSEWTDFVQDAELVDDEDGKETEPTEPEETEPQETEPEETEPEETEPKETEPKDNEPNIPQFQSEDGGIPDKEVPKAVVPKTGDISLIWTLLSGLSAGGLVVLNRKKED